MRMMMRKLTASLCWARRRMSPSAQALGQRIWSRPKSCGMQSRQFSGPLPRRRRCARLSYFDFARERVSRSLSLVVLNWRNDKEIVFGHNSLSERGVGHRLRLAPDQLNLSLPTGSQTAQGYLRDKYQRSFTCISRSRRFGSQRAADHCLQSGLEYAQAPDN